MANDDGRVWSPSDPERFQARFRTWYQIMNIMELTRKTQAGTAQLKEYAKEHPVEAQRLQNMNTIVNLSGASALAGFIGATTAIWRWSKTKPLVVAGGVIAPVAAFLVVEDIASLAFGTFKFDNHKETEDFLRWADKRDENTASQ